MKLHNFKKICLLAFFAFASYATTSAQGSDPVPPGTVGVPIDGGIIGLLIAGGLYGAKKIYDKQKNRNKAKESE